MVFYKLPCGILNSAAHISLYTIKESGDWWTVKDLEVITAYMQYFTGRWLQKLKKTTRKSRYLVSWLRCQPGKSSKISLQHNHYPTCLIKLLSKTIPLVHQLWDDTAPKNPVVKFEKPFDAKWGICYSVYFILMYNFYLKHFLFH